MTALTGTAVVSKRAVNLELRCATAKCSGVITLVDIKTELGHGKYDLGAGQTGYATVGLFPQVLSLLAERQGPHRQRHRDGDRDRRQDRGQEDSRHYQRPSPGAGRLALHQAGGLGQVCVACHCGARRPRASARLSLVDVRTGLGHANYDLAAGQTGHVRVVLFEPALALLAGAKDHTINATETVTVKGGKTVRTTVTLVGPSWPWYHGRDRQEWVGAVGYGRAGRSGAR